MNGGGGGGREVWLAERKVGSLQIYLSNFGFCMCFCCSVNMFKKKYCNIKDIKYVC